MFAHAWRTIVCLISVAFLGGIYFLPFLGAAAALEAWRDEDALSCNPFVFPCTMMV